MPSEDAGIFTYGRTRDLAIRKERTRVLLKRCTALVLLLIGILASPGYYLLYLFYLLLSIPVLNAAAAILKRAKVLRPERLCSREFPGAPASVSAPPSAVQPMHQDGPDSRVELPRKPSRSWAQLIKKVYEANPLVCPRCSGPLKIISLIGDGPVIEKILRHLKLWHRPERPPPSSANPSIHYDKENVDFDEAGQWPVSTA